MSNNRYPGPPLPVDEQSPHPGSSVTTGFKPTVRKVTPPNPLRTLNASAPVFNSQSRVTSICTFNADVLPTFQTYEGEISHIENGPFFFFVQLKNKVDDLDRMMHHIQTMEFEKLTDTPVLGMACLADFKVIFNGSYLIY